MQDIKQNLADRRLPIIEKKIRMFNRNNILCAFIHYGAGILATLLSALIVAKPSFLQNPDAFEVVSITSFFLVALISFVSPSRLAVAWGAGCRRMEAAYYRYQSDPDYPVAKVFDAYEEAEKRINHVEEITVNTK